MISRTHFLAALVVLAAAGPARAAELEHRVFTVAIDGKPAGESRMSMQTLDDGTHLMAAQSAMIAKRGNSTWRYSYRALETWKAGRLQKFESFSEDDGKKRHVVAGVQGQALRVTVNDHRHDVPLDAWTTSYWFLPTAIHRTHSVALFDVDTGKELAAQLEYVGSERRTVLTTESECSHYRVKSAPVTTDLWYDGADRLVRQVTLQNGRKTVLELAKVQK